MDNYLYLSYWQVHQNCPQEPRLFSNPPPDIAVIHDNRRFLCAFTFIYVQILKVLQIILIMHKVAKLKLKKSKSVQRHKSKFIKAKVNHLSNRSKKILPPITLIPICFRGRRWTVNRESGIWCKEGSG